MTSTELLQSAVRGTLIAFVEERDAATLAAEALRLAMVNPDEAASLAHRARQAGRARGDWGSVSVARRASGLAALHQWRLSDAVFELRQAIKAAERAGVADLAGEAQMSLASALVLRGAPALAFDSIEAALARLTGASAARARTQRSAILQELGRVDEALEDLRHALPILRRSGDAEWEMRALSNRSLMLGSRRQFAAAESDLLRARELCVQHGMTLAGAYVEQNLGCVCADRGDVPAALEHFDAAAARYQELGLDVGSLLVDRANVLLSVRLVAEARENAEAAVEVFAAQGRKVHLPEAQLLLSTTALLQNDIETALSASRSAARAFARLGRHEWLVLARYAEIQAQVAAGTARHSTAVDSRPSEGHAVSVARIRACAADLERTGWTVPALEARLLAGGQAMRRGRSAEAREELALASRARWSGPAAVRARAWLAEARLRNISGERRGAKAALRAGLRLLDEDRLTLGATELRAHVSVHRGALARTGLRMALEEKNARAVHWWAERGRSNATLLRPVRPPDDPELVHELQDLRATMAEIDAARISAQDTRALVARQVRLEHRIRDHTRRSPGDRSAAPTVPPSIGQLSAVLGRSALVEFIDFEDTLRAVTVVDGRARLHDLGSSAPVRHWVTHIPFALHRLAHPATRPAQLAAARQVLAHGAATLDALLLAPVVHALGDRPLVVIPTGWLQSVPWSVLPSCVGRPVSVSPSAALWHAAAGRLSPASDSGASRVAVIAGPGLAGADAEASLVARLYPGATTLRGSAATAAAAAQAMDGARTVHVAAHGVLRSDNPLFSSLSLADGPFTVYDLERLSRAPQHVILAACNTALSHVTAGEEILGLAAALLTAGTATLVAPVVPVADAETAPLMSTYHERVVGGDPPAVALAAAQQRHQHDSVRAYASAAGFICLGAGW